MKLTRILLTLALAAPLGLGCAHDERHDHERPIARQDGASGGERARPDAPDDDDGTHDDAVAQGDAAPTALDQSEDATDVEITRRIREAVVGDSSLSFGARNCVIVTQHGVVTLRGDVTRAERDAIDRHAREVAGVTRVDDLLNVTDADAAP